MARLNEWAQELGMFFQISRTFLYKNSTQGNFSLSQYVTLGADDLPKAKNLWLDSNELLPSFQKMRHEEIMKKANFFILPFVLA